MEAVVNFIEPNERIHIDYDKIKDECDDRGQLTYKYNDKYYTTINDAVAAYIVDTIGMVDTRKMTQLILHEILNPPHNYIPEDGDVFDLDVNHIDTYDKDMNIIPKKFYIPKDRYYTSCPHHNVDHIRRVENGLISCDIHRLVMYSKIIDWYEDYKHKLTSRPTFFINKEFEGNTPYKNLITKVLGEVDQNPLIIFENYKTGIINNSAINTLTINGLLFDYKSGLWYTIDQKTDYTFEEHLMMFKLRILLEFPYIALDTTHPNFLLKIIELAATNLKDLKIITSKVFVDVVRKYFEGLHQYQTQIFNLGIEDWMVLEDNIVYAIPQIYKFIIRPNEHGIGSGIFINTIISINRLNNE